MSASNSSRRNTEPRVSSNHAFTVGRFGIIFFITAAIAIAIAFKLVGTTIIYADRWNSKAAGTLNRVDTVMPYRGEILASDGSILATNLYYFNVMMDLRSEAFKVVEFNKALPQLCDSLAKYLPQRTSKEWFEKFDVQMKKHKSKRTRNFVLAKGVPADIVDRIKSFPFFRDFRRAGHTGLKTEPVLKRVYPFGKMARRSVGRVGMTDSCAEIHGISGLECALDTLLFGKCGTRRLALTNRGTKMVVDVPAIDGYDVYSTIDITMQDILEAELNDMLVKSQAQWGTAILMEVATGDIKAISNLELDKKNGTYIEALNRALQAYEPGSVMKVMTMAVGLEKGFAKPITRDYSIGHTITYLNRKLSDTHSPATLPISRFIEYSSNIGMVKMTMPYYENRRKQFRADLAEMGFFDTLNTGMVGERPPKFISDPSKLDLSRMVFGYATVIPPLYTCAFYNAVANDGRFVRPRLVKGLRTPDGRDSIMPVSYVRERMMSSENAAILRKMIHGVVWEQGGTAKVLRNDLVEIAGKTGTSRIAIERSPSEAKQGTVKGGYMEGAHYRVTFCGFFPYENPKYTCIVVISDPQLPYRGPALSSGTVLKNVALKLYARSLLNDNPEFVESPDANGPVIYSSFNSDRNATLNRDLALRKPRAIRKPAAATAGCVPDVKGVSIREALSKLEACGYSVDFDGVGYVYMQTPEAGEQAGPGTKVKLSLKYD